MKLQTTLTNVSFADSEDRSEDRVMYRVDVKKRKEQIRSRAGHGLFISGGASAAVPRRQALLYLAAAGDVSDSEHGVDRGRGSGALSRDHQTILQPSLHVQVLREPSKPWSAGALRACRQVVLDYHLITALISFRRFDAAAAGQRTQSEGGWGYGARAFWRLDQTTQPQHPGRRRPVGTNS